jgi:hypothetical protein
MDCDTCGRHRPSAEIAPLREGDGRLVMACARCRRLAPDRRGPASPAGVPAASVAVGPAVLALTR